MKLDEFVKSQKMRFCIFPRNQISANNMYKDLCSAIKLAAEVGVSLPATSIAREVLQAAKNQGKGDLDSCVVMTVVESLANTTVVSQQDKLSET